jgi:hypothetical protein
MPEVYYRLKWQRIEGKWKIIWKEVQNGIILFH